MPGSAGTRSHAGDGDIQPRYPGLKRYSSHTTKQLDLPAGAVPDTVTYAPVVWGQKNGDRRADEQFAAQDLRVHLVGIGGCGMSGAAGILKQRGAIVSGSDRCDSSALARLTEQGVRVHVGQHAENVASDCQMVVHSAAIKSDNPELLAAREHGCRVVKYAELLGLLMADRLGVAISGTHGKSTTSAMTTFVLKEAGLDPSFVIGAGVEQLGGGSGVGRGDPFVVEACEFDRSFLHLHPKIATILNVEEDHLDYYSGLEEIISSFSDFASQVPGDGLLIVNGDDRNAMRAVEKVRANVETFGFDTGVDWQAEITGSPDGRLRFNVYYRRHFLTEMMLSLPGRHNVSNALAAMAVCYHCGIAPETIGKALGRFKGAHRRLTCRGRVDGVTVVDDYAHHPTELQATLRAAREYYTPRKLYVVFQPHQHSRTRFLLHDFARSFGSADVVIVPDIYFVRDSEAERDLIAADDLVKQIHLNGGEARYEPDFACIAAQLCAEVEPGDVVITMGAGDVWRIGDQLLACLQKTRGASTVKDEEAGQSANAGLY